MSAESGNPLPANGLAGRLTPSQYAALKSFWKELFHLVDNAPDKGSAPDGDTHSPTGLEADSDSREPPPGSSNSSGPPSVVKDENLKEKLRAEQELRDAKAALETYGRSRFLDTFWGMIMMDDPDVIVLKFLRARKWNVPAGVAMMAACIKWRIEYGVDEIIRKGEEGFLNKEGFLHQLKIGKTFVQGTDKQGRPVVYINVRLHKASDQSPKTLEDFIVFSMESVRLMLTPPLVEKATIIIDMSGFGLANMDWKSLAFIVKCLESYYPESLNILVVHNPPWVFQGLWKIIAPMLDPVVRSKIQITKTSDELKVHIDESHLVESLGGTNGWNWNYEPVIPNENIQMADAAARAHELRYREKIIQSYMDSTRKWCEGGGPVEHIVDQIVMDEDMSVSAQLRKLIMYHLRVHYFVLDPYIRGRSIYHRKGRVVGNGLITFEYPKVAPKGTSDEEIDVWEVLGYPTSRESLIVRIEQMNASFTRQGIVLPDL